MCVCGGVCLNWFRPIDQNGNEVKISPKCFKYVKISSGFGFRKEGNDISNKHSR